jgi:nucleotide-binding universal stress UspA family protein
MGMHILVATDLTDRSELAVSRAAMLCRETRATELSLLHVVAAGLPPSLADQQRGAAETFLAQRLVALQNEAAAGSFDTIIRTGTPFDAIIGESLSRAADLVVIGAPGRHRYAEFFMGTTAELVIRIGVQPVLMVKKEPREPYRRVLAAFDSSEGSVRALHMALAIAPTAQFRVVHAWRPPLASIGGMEAAREAIDRENARLKVLIHEAASTAITRPQSAGADVSIELREENPHQVIASQCGWADLLVMGTHSKGRLASTVNIGSLARHLLVEAPCDVLTSRP